MFTAGDEAERLLAQNFAPRRNDANAKQAQGSKSDVPDQYLLDAEALRAQFDVEKKALQFFSAAGGVNLQKIVKPGDGRRDAKGQWLVYRDQKAILYGNPASIEEGGRKVFSRKFTFYELEKKAVCEGPVHVVLPLDEHQGFFALDNRKGSPVEKLRPETPMGKRGNAAQKSKNMEIFCEGPVEFLQARNRIVFQDKVKVLMAEASLFCEILEVHLAENQIVALTAHKRVQLVSEEYTALADQLHWDEKAGLASLTGSQSVTLSSPQFTMVAPVIWYDIKNRRFVTRGNDVRIEHRSR
jgi:lipopolysaccharide export system protein LptA